MATYNHCTVKKKKRKRKKKKKERKKERDREKLCPIASFLPVSFVSPRTDPFLAEGIVISGNQ